MANVYHDVKLDKVDLKHLTAALKSLKLKASKDVKECIDTLLDHEKKNPPKKIAECEVCGGSASAEFDECPFCGVGEEDTPSSPAVDTDTKTKDTEAPPPVAEEKTATPKKGAKKGAKKTATPAEDKPTEVTAIVMSKKTTAVVKHDAQELDAKLALITALKSEVWANGWRMGKVIAEIRDKNLWKQRNTEDGKPKYKSFEQFCPAELGFSDNQALRFMDVSERFTEAQVREFGTSKLALVLEAPKEDQEEILEEQVKKNASTKEVQEAVKKARAARGGKPRDTGRKKTPKGKAPPKKKAKKPAAPRKDAIMIATLEGTKTVKLFKRENPEVPAKHVADEPSGRLELENDVVLLFTIVNSPDGAMVLKVRGKREG